MIEATIVKAIAKADDNHTGISVLDVDAGSKAKRKLTLKKLQGKRKPSALALKIGKDS